MTQFRPFLFDTSFDPVESRPAKAAAKPVPAPPPAEPPPPTYSAAQLAAARAEGLTEGMAKGQAAGEAAARAAVERKLDETIAAALAAAQTMADRQDGADGQLLEQSIQIGLAIARRMMPELERRHGLTEIEALLSACLADMREEPRLVVRVADALLDPLRARVGALAAAQGFEGAMVLLGDPELAPGDARVEWADGGADRLARNVWQEIDRVIARILDYPDPLQAAAAALPSTPHTAI